MKCPICQDDLKPSDFGEYGFVIIDICPNCQGSWFDKGELDRLDDSVWTNAEQLEFHEAKPDKKDIKCPKCNTNLESLSPKDEKGPIIDRCPSCQGFWLDKGELDQIKNAVLEIDDEIAKSMKPLQRPNNWSQLRWIVYCFKECYLKK